MSKPGVFDPEKVATTTFSCLNCYSAHTKIELNPECSQLVITCLDCDCEMKVTAEDDNNE